MPTELKNYAFILDEQIFHPSNLTHSSETDIRGPRGSLRRGVSASGPSALNEGIAAACSVLEERGHQHSVLADSDSHHSNQTSQVHLVGSVCLRKRTVEDDVHWMSSIRVLFCFVYLCHPTRLLRPNVPPLDPGVFFLLRRVSPGVSWRTQSKMQADS